MKSQFAVVVGVACLLVTASAFAHHPFAAEYDWTKPVTLNGTVTMFEWTNPHASLHIEAKDESGQMKEWTLEMGSPGALTRAGWTKTSLKKGDTITVDAWLAKTEKNRANVKSVKLADGRELSGASSIADFKQATTEPTSN